jgi:hypothetical protein
MGLTHRAGHQRDALLLRQRIGEQYLLDGHVTVQPLVVTAPDPPHTALTDRFGQQVPAGNQDPYPTGHANIIGDEPEIEVTRARAGLGEFADRSRESGLAGRVRYLPEP